MSYNATDVYLREAVLNQSGYYGVKAPTSLCHRYLFDDIPTGLVPIASLGRHCGVSVPTMESIIRLGSVVHDVDYWKSGRTVDKLGLGSLNASDLTQYVNVGIVR